MIYFLCNFVTIIIKIMVGKDTFLKNKSLLNCKGNLLDISKPLIMGILNITPDSFYDGGKYKSEGDIIAHVSSMINDGADIIDVGAVSTRPGADLLTEEIEKQRLVPVLRLINNHFPDLIISVDTFRSEIAKLVVNNYNASIINDISGGTLDNAMFRTIAELNVPYILMHIKGTPKDMQLNLKDSNIIEELISYFTVKVEELKTLGVNDIIIDTGFGFGKTLEQNYTILKNLDIFKIFGLPILVGVSRKSMINKLLNISPDDALNATTILNILALTGGANILRVHDVKEAKETITIFNKYINSDI